MFRSISDLQRIHFVCLVYFCALTKVPGTVLPLARVCSETLCPYFRRAEVHTAHINACDDSVNPNRL